MFGISERFRIRLLTIILLLLVSITAESASCPKCNGNMYPGRDGEVCEKGCDQESKDDEGRASFSQQFGDKLEKYLMDNDSLDENIKATLQRLADFAHQISNNPQPPGQLPEELRNVLESFQTNNQQIRSLFDGAAWQSYFSRRRNVSITPILSQEALTEVLTLFFAIDKLTPLNSGRIQAMLLLAVLQQLDASRRPLTEEALTRNSLQLQSLLLFWLIHMDNQNIAAKPVVSVILCEMFGGIPNRHQIDSQGRLIIDHRLKYDLEEPSLADRFLKDRRGKSGYHIFTMENCGLYCFGLTVLADQGREWVFLMHSMTLISANANDLHWVINRLQEFHNPTTFTDTLYRGAATIYTGAATIFHGLERLPGAGCENKLALGVGVSLAVALIFITAMDSNNASGAAKL